MTDNPVFTLVKKFSGFRRRSVQERGEDAIKLTQAERIYSSHFSGETSTPLRDFLQNQSMENPGKSGFRIFDKGEASLYARLALVGLAERTIDLQYYAVANDVTSNIMMEAILRAAERHVRVRFLIDGFTLSKVVKDLSVFERFKNVEIRVFNPVGFVHENFVSKSIQNFLSPVQARSRMHNKALICDGHMAIVGGRNLGDEYFEADTEVSFKDVDILAAGPISQDISKSFDDFWNHGLAFPLAAVSRVRSAASGRAREKLSKNWKDCVEKFKPKFDLDQPIERLLNDDRIRLIWAPATLYADRPEKLLQSAFIESPPAAALKKSMDDAKHEVVMVSSYFVPASKGMDWLSRLRDRSVNVRILTNSLASTDVVAVHSGYSRYRKPLLRKGVALYEFKPVNRKRRQRLVAKTSPARAGLHTKLYIFDGRYSLIGSFNFDPRSMNFNTEILICIDSSAIAASLQSGFEEAASIDASYHLKILGNGKIVWRTGEGQKDVSYHADPGAGLGRRLQNFLFSALPIEKDL